LEPVQEAKQIDEAMAESQLSQVQEDIEASQ